jgi:hypothetical protein
MQLAQEPVTFAKVAIAPFTEATDVLPLAALEPQAASSNAPAATAAIAARRILCLRFTISRSFAAVPVRPLAGPTRRSGISIARERGIAALDPLRPDSEPERPDALATSGRPQCKEQNLSHPQSARDSPVTVASGAPRLIPFGGRARKPAVCERVSSVTGSTLAHLHATGTWRHVRATAATPRRS